MTEEPTTPETQDPSETEGEPDVEGHRAPGGYPVIGEDDQDTEGHRVFV